MFEKEKPGRQAVVSQFEIGLSYSPLSRRLALAAMLVGKQRRAL